MDPVEHADRDERGPEDNAATPPPIVIVQQGRATWAKELLLICLLVFAGSYIVYQEYRRPSIIIRDEPRQGGRVVDAVAVAPVADGDLVLRTAMDGDPLDDAQGGAPPSDPDEQRRDPPGRGEPDQISPPDRPDLLERPDEPRSPVLPKASEFAAAGPLTPWDDQFAAVIAPEALPSIDRLPFPEGGRPEAAEDEPARPPRGHREIVWDLDRRERPAPAAPDRIQPEHVQALGDPLPERGEPLEDRFEPQTLAQRHHFHQCLVYAIRQHGLRAGPLIEGLCQDFGTSLPPELDFIDQQVGPKLIAPGSDFERTIDVLRKLGAPESYLLDRLSEQMNRTIGARHGPRDRMEARVFAARKLLSVPLRDVADGIR